MIESNVGLLTVLIILVISVGGLVEIVPLMFSARQETGNRHIVPRTALSKQGFDIYVREGCYLCHSQQIRPFRSETERYGPYSVAAESQYDHPFQFGSKRTGPDLARVGGRYSDDWHRVHLHNPRDVVPESNMPGYPVACDTNLIDGADASARCGCCACSARPIPMTTSPARQRRSTSKTEQDALIAYLQIPRPCTSARHPEGMRP